MPQPIYENEHSRDDGNYDPFLRGGNLTPQAQGDRKQGRATEAKATAAAEERSEMRMSELTWNDDWTPRLLAAGARGKLP